jgi:hypothetical protein
MVLLVLISLWRGSLVPLLLLLLKCSVVPLLSLLEVLGGAAPVVAVEVLRGAAPVVVEEVPGSSGQHEPSLAPPPPGSAVCIQSARIFLGKNLELLAKREFSHVVQSVFWKSDVFIALHAAGLPSPA